MKRAREYTAYIKLIYFQFCLTELLATLRDTLEVGDLRGHLRTWRRVISGEITAYSSASRAIEI